MMTEAEIQGLLEVVRNGRDRALHDALGKLIGAGLCIQCGKSHPTSAKVFTVCDDCWDLGEVNRDGS